MTTVKSIPDGYPRVIPYLSLDGTSAAIDFYTKVFGAQERVRMPGPEGKIGHAELEIGDSVFVVADAFADMGGRTPQSLGGTPVTVTVYVEDVDAVFDRATSPARPRNARQKNQFYGDRAGQFLDPFGHKWFAATHVEDVRPEEMAGGCGHGG